MVEASAFDNKDIDEEEGSRCLRRSEEPSGSFLSLFACVSVEGRRREIWQPKPLLVDPCGDGRLGVSRLVGGSHNLGRAVRYLVVFVLERSPSPQR